MVNPYAIPYENQQRAAEQIMDDYLSTEVRYVLLRADVQSGKTGTYHYLIRLMMAHGLIDQAYIVCGSHETELRNQCLKDVQEWHAPEHQENIHVVFRQDFKKTRMVTERTLIIVDESHLVQGKDQTLSKFLESHKLSMSGTRWSMVRNQTYLLSVDATPYAEESAMAWNEGHEKTKVTLHNGLNYYGIREYYENLQIRPAFDLSTTQGKEIFRSLLRSHPKKYILIRCMEKKQKSSLTMKTCAEEEGCDIRYFTSKYENGNAQLSITQEEAIAHRRRFHKNILCLEEEPEKTTVVFIEGRLRCGKRVPKKHIGFVWESTKQGKTDIICQGLLGRMCGYLGDGPYHVPEGEKPLIFIPARLLKKEGPNKVEARSDIERSFADHGEDLLPRYANNLIPSNIQTIMRDRDGHIVTPCVPIRFQLTREQRDRLHSSNELTVKEFCLNRLADNMRLINQNYNLTAEQKNEINQFLAYNYADDCYIRNYRETSNQNMHKSHVEAYRTQTSASEHIQNPGTLTFCVVYPGFQPQEEVKEECVPGQVYAIFYTRSQGDYRRIHKESRIAHVNKATHFTIQATEELLDCEGGGLHGFSPLIRQDSQVLLRELDLFIALSKQPVGVFSKRLTSFQNGETMKFPVATYGANLENLKDIFQQLEEKYNTKIAYEVVNVRARIFQGPNYAHEISFISWA
jgi:hypothetical protein